MLQKKRTQHVQHTRKHQSHHATINGATPTQIRRRGEHATFDATATRSSLFNSKRRTRKRRRKHKIGENWTPEIPHQRAIKLVRTQLYRPKIPIFSSAFVLAIIFIIAPYVDKTYHKISEEGRVASDLGDVRFDVGKFTVQVREFSD